MAAKEQPATSKSVASGKRATAPTTPGIGSSNAEPVKEVTLKVHDSESEKDKPRSKVPKITPPSTTASAPLTPQKGLQPPPAVPTPRKAIKKPDVSLLIPPAPVVEQEAIISRKTKKNKPMSRPSIKPGKEPKSKERVKSNESVEPESKDAPSPIVDTPQSQTSLKTADEVADNVQRSFQVFEGIDLSLLSFFDESSISPFVKIPLKYGPLVYALSTLSAGEGAASQALAVGNIDSAVTSFQQLLETLTQTISDLVRLFPRTTWEDSTSFDSVLRDMLKTEEFFDEVPPLEIASVTDSAKTGRRSSEVAALTLALEKRARWMEAQLAKLETLHRDINTAAICSVMNTNDRGWDRRRLLPRSGGSLVKLEHIGKVRLDDGSVRNMTLEELEAELVLANQETASVEGELREVMRQNQAAVPGVL